MYSIIFSFIWQKTFTHNAIILDHIINILSNIMNIIFKINTKRKILIIILSKNVIQNNNANTRNYKYNSKYNSKNY
jgi:hypothetical protein